MKSLGERLLGLVLPPTDRKHALDELEELYELKVAKTGKGQAERWRRHQVWLFVLKALPTFWWRRPLSGFLRMMVERDGRLRWLDHLLQDVRFSLRSLRRRPGASWAAILILGIGIGATTTIFSVVDTVVLRPLPYPDSGELFSFGGYGGTRPSMYRRWRDGLQSFEAMGASWNVSSNLTDGGEPKRLRTSRVTEHFLPMFGASPHLGRLLMPHDWEGDPAVGVLGHGFWQRQWGEDPSVVGSHILVEGKQVLVAGIMSPDFDPPEAVTGAEVDLWLPFDVDDPDISTWSILAVVGRLKDGVGFSAATEELRALTTHLAEEIPEDLRREDGSVRHTSLVPLQLATVRSVAPSLLLLMGAVLLMLAIACANVANLLLAQGSARVREFALRGALGAGRRRLVRQLLTESMILALIGGALGTGLAFFGVKVALRYSPGGVPRLEDLAVNPRVLLFALLASASTGLLFGLLPALRGSRRDVAVAIKEGGTTSAGTLKGKRTRRGLVVAEIAIALVLLTGAGLFFRSLVAMARVDPGFQTDRLVMVPLHLGGGYEATRRQQFTEEVITRLEAFPETEEVAAGLTAPFQYVGGSMCCIWHEVRAAGGGVAVRPLPMVMTQPVTPDYFKTLQADITYGREFVTLDLDGDGQIAVINEATARHFFGTPDAVGRTLDVGNWGEFTVVGVAGGVHHWGLAQGVPPAIYVPYSRWGAFSDFYTLMVRSTIETEALASMIRETVRAFDPSLPVDEVIPIQQRVETAMVGQRFLSNLLGVFASIALILAIGGIYATMLQAVGQRRREMGIRMALGADRGQMVGMVFRGGMGLTGVGILFGMGASLVLTQILRSFLFGIGVIDPLTAVSVVAILGASALLACIMPAVRAARINPIETLKAE